jgi:hypothetical protein
MHEIASGLAALLAVAIMVIGVRYLAQPRLATASFGLPLPEDGPNVDWWLRLKGVRDVASGLAVFALMFLAGPRAVGMVLLAEATIPVGDMLTILAAKGSTRIALGVHGATAVVMVLTAFPLILRGA